MELCIQDPSYNNSKYLHESLLAAFDVALEGGGAYAFATSDGIELLLCDDSFKKFIENGKFQLIVGMDDITNRKALETLKELQARYPDRLSVKAYVHKKHGSTFHPKYSWFKTNDGGLLIIGSGNLTQQGLRQNREAYSIITCDRQTFNAMIEGWKKWVEHSAPFLFDVDDEKVLYLASQNKKKTTAIAEAKRTVRENFHCSKFNIMFIFIFFSFMCYFMVNEQMGFKWHFFYNVRKRIICFSKTTIII